MADLHIEEFFKDAARVLVQLYNAFPRKTTVYVEDIAGPDAPDEFGLHSPRHQACFSCMLWLAEEGYLRYVDTIRQEAIDQAVLTQKAFVLLNGVASEDLATRAQGNAVPLSVAEDLHSHISIIRKTLAEGSSSAIARLMRELLNR